MAGDKSLQDRFARSITETVDGGGTVTNQDRSLVLITKREVSYDNTVRVDNSLKYNA